MSDIVGIRFGDSGKTYCFKAEGVELKRGDRVVVESELGISIGKVYKVNCTLKSPEQGLKPVLRKVTAGDLKQEEENEEVRDEALEYCKERIKARGLPMKLLTADVTLDRKRFIFYFVADTRIDFRELVKDLASKFRTRIELRQIGVRDAAKMTGGFGVCGKEFCCKTFLKSFAPISIKMAKQQDLVLNTCKLSGACGRLMCCLGFEYLTPEELKKVRAIEAEEARIAAEKRAEEEAREAEEARIAAEAQAAEEARIAAEAAEARKAREQAQPEGRKPSKRRRRSRRKGPRGEAKPEGQPRPPAEAGQAAGAERAAQENKEKTARPGKRRRRRPRKKKAE